MLDKFFVLMTAYRNKMPLFRSIIFYTWLFPCSKCTGVIVEKLGSYASECEVVLVYTRCREREMPDYDKNTKRFISAGIEVREEKLDEELKPAFCPS